MVSLLVPLLAAVAALMLVILVLLGPLSHQICIGGSEALRFFKELPALTSKVKSPSKRSPCLSLGLSILQDNLVQDLHPDLLPLSLRPPHAHLRALGASAALGAMEAGE